MGDTVWWRVIQNWNIWGWERENFWKWQWRARRTSSHIEAQTSEGYGRKHNPYSPSGVCPWGESSFLQSKHATGLPWEGWGRGIFGNDGPWVQESTVDGLGNSERGGWGERTGDTQSRIGMRSDLGVRGFLWWHHWDESREETGLGRSKADI